MRERKKYVIVAIAASVLTLMVSAGLALAEGDSAPSDLPGFPGPRGGGPAGFGERGEMRDLMVGGEVTAVDGSSITLKTVRTGEEVKVTVNGDTTYRSRDGEASLEDVKVGEHVGIRLTEPRADGVDPVAEAVMIGKPGRGARHDAAVGEVTAVDGDRVTINTADGEKQFTLPEISAGMRLGVAADEEGNVKAVIYDPPERPADAPEGE